MAALYRTRSDDMLDLVCFRHYGARTGMIELVLNANPGLCERGPLLPQGLILTLPDAPQSALPAARIKLWD